MSLFPRFISNQPTQCTYIFNNINTVWSVVALFLCVAIHKTLFAQHKILPLCVSSTKRVTISWTARVVHITSHTVFSQSYCGLADFMTQHTALGIRQRRLVTFSFPFTLLLATKSHRAIPRRALLYVEIYTMISISSTRPHNRLGECVISYYMR